MKAHLTILMLIFAIASFATVQLQPGLDLSQAGNSYVVYYYNEDFEMRDTTLTDDDGDHTFSYIQISPDYYDYIGEECSPMYPAYTLHLQLPSNATNVRVNMQNQSETRLELHNPYLPVQTSITGQTDPVCIDNFLYSNNVLMDQYYPNLYTLGSTYERIFAHGIDFTIYPVHYNIEGTANILTEATFVITYDGDNLESLCNGISQTTINYFDNHHGCCCPCCCGNHDRNDEDCANRPHIDNEPYLIITERQYEDTINVFKAHKETLGYRVIVEYVDSIGHSVSDIRQRIQYYHNYGKLKYVLLAGSLSAIPFSSGRDGYMTNPPTDIYYTCWDSHSIGSQTDFHTQVFLGRWDVNDKSELSTIMRKTIKSELSMFDNNTYRIASFSGTDRPRLSNIAQAEWIKTDVIDASTYLTGCFFDGRNANTPNNLSYNDIKNEIENIDYPLWMFVYFGGGDYDRISEPYNFQNNDINNCTNNNLPYQPFGFSFANRNGNLYQHNCFARSWTNVENGGITMMAPTVKATIECNRWFSRKIFSPLEEQNYTITIGELIANAKEKYYYNDKVAYRRNHIAKYILLGDPSLYVQGLEIPEEYYHRAPSRRTYSTEILPHKVRVMDINGHFLEEVLYTEYMDHPYPNGVYFIQLLDNEDKQINVTKVIK